MSTTKRRVNYLSKMKIGEVSLVMNPACPGADVLFTKARDVSDEPRDARGRWTRVAERAREHAAIASSYARSLASKVLASTGVKTIASIRPTATHPVAGGGLQFDFRHTLPNGDIYNSSVQIRPEHLRFLPKGTPAPAAGSGMALAPLTVGTREYALRHAGMAAPPAAGFNLQETIRTAMERTEAHLRRYGQTDKPVFQSNRKFGILEGNRVTAAAAAAAPAGGLGLGAGAGATAQTGPGLSRIASNGFPIYDVPREAPGWVGPRADQPRDANGNEIPLKGATYETSGGRAYLIGDHLVPSARQDIQANIERVYRWKDSSPAYTDAALNADRRSPATSNGRGYWMAPQDIGGAKIQGYVPGGDQQAQEKIEGQYGRYKNRLRREIGAIASTAGTRAPLVLSRTEQNAAEDHFFEKPGAKSGETLALAHKLEQSTQNEIDRLALTHEEVSHLHRSMSSVPREDVTPAQKTLHERLGRYIGGHISGDEEMQKSLFPSSETAVHKIRRVPDGIARGIFHAEEREHKYQLSGFDKSTLSTRHTKSSGSPVDYAQKVAKSKFRRGAHG